MSPVFEFLFEPYKAYSWATIGIEITAVLFGFASVWYSKQNKIAVFPTGMLSTALFVYLLWKAGLLGDMLINAYYFIMSIFGWYYWTQKKGNQRINPISITSIKEWIQALLLFIGTLIFVGFIYSYWERWTSWTAYVDTFTTALFFVGMWLMAKRKIENWIFWIIGDCISIPLYYYKGLTLTSLQFIFFTFLAFWGYQSWKQYLNKQSKTSIA